MQEEEKQPGDKERSADGHGRGGRGALQECWSARRLSAVRQVMDRLRQHNGDGSIGGALWDMLLRRGCLLPELVFYLLCFVANADEADKSLVSSAQRQQLVIAHSLCFVVPRAELQPLRVGEPGSELKEESEEVTEERAWRLVMAQRLEEWTRPERFVAVLRRNLYFADSAEEEHASRVWKEALPSASAFLRFVQMSDADYDALPLHHPRPRTGEEGFVVNVHLVVRQRDDVHDSPGEEHYTYLIDIPRVPVIICGDEKEHQADSNASAAAYIIQLRASSRETSVRPISATALIQHLRLLALFDGRTKLNQAYVIEFVRGSLVEIPVPGNAEVDEVYLNHPTLLQELEAGEAALNEEGGLRVEVVSFDVASYDLVMSAYRLRQHLAVMYGDEPDEETWRLRTVPYGWPTVKLANRVKWQDVLYAIIQPGDASVHDLLPSPVNKPATSNDKSNKAKPKNCLIS